MTAPPPSDLTAPIASIGELSRELAALLELEGPDTPGLHDDLIAWGLDSLRLMTLVERLRASGMETSFVELAEQPTLAGLAHHLGLST